MPYSCETWSLILREEWRLRVFENRTLRLMFRPKKYENAKWIHVIFSALKKNDLKYNNLAYKRNRTLQSGTISE